MGEFISAVVAGTLFMLLICLLIALPIMWLWNWLIPAIFGLTTITAIQALGLSILSGLLFKSYSGGQK